MAAMAARPSVVPAAAAQGAVVASAVARSPVSSIPAAPRRNSTAADPAAANQGRRRRARPLTGSGGRTTWTNRARPAAPSAVT
jgi:hypothetical protein